MLYYYIEIHVIIKDKIKKKEKQGTLKEQTN